MTHMSLSKFRNVSCRHFTKLVSLSLVVFIVGVILTQLDISTIFNCSGLALQTIALVIIWMTAAYSIQESTRHWLSTISAFLMTTVALALLFNSNSLGLSLPIPLATVSAVFISILWSFFLKSRMNP